MPKFVTREYLGYEFALRDYNPKKNVRRIKRLYRTMPHPWPYTNGDDLDFDLVIVPTKRAVSDVCITYQWALKDPRGKVVHAASFGEVPVARKQAAKVPIHLGHMSLTGQFRLELVLSALGEAPSPTYIVDFQVRPWDSVSWWWIQLLANAAVAAFIAFWVAMLTTGHTGR